MLKGEKMRQIFIDANIYLDFYALHIERFRTLLPTLVGLKDRIFVSAQLVDEVERNKLPAFLVHANNFYTRLPTKLDLPSFDRDGNTKVQKGWNAKLEAVRADLEEIRSKYEESVRRIAQGIVDGTDPVSTQLGQLFATAEAPTEDHLQSARQRKERGNPPGKRTDPLGDQISWQQFLEQVQIGKPVWIISRDSDYFDTVLDELRLKTLLNKELRSKIGPKARIHCFKELASALDSINSTGKVPGLPKKTALRKIANDEASANVAVELSGATANSVASPISSSAFIGSPAALPRVFPLSNTSAIFVPAQTTGFFLDALAYGADPLQRCPSCGNSGYVLLSGGNRKCATCGTDLASRAKFELT